MSVFLAKLAVKSFAPTPSPRTYTGTEQAGPKVVPLFTVNVCSIRSSTPAAVATWAFLPTCRSQTTYTPGVSVVCEPSSNVTAPLVPGVSVADVFLATFTGAPPAHENDGNGGGPAMTGAAKEFGPEFCGATFDPAVVEFAKTSHTAHSSVTRIESATS